MITQQHKDEQGNMKHSEVYGAIINTYAVKDVTIKTVVNQGESFIYKDGKWTDLTIHKEELIKALYDDEVESNTKEEFEEYYPNGIKDFGVDNYPIKAFLIPGGAGDEEPATQTDPAQTEPDTNKNEDKDHTDKENGGNVQASSTEARHAGAVTSVNASSAGKTSSTATGDRNFMLPAVIAIAAAGAGIIISMIILSKRRKGH